MSLNSFDWSVFSELGTELSITDLKLEVVKAKAVLNREQIPSGCILCKIPACRWRCKCNSATAGAQTCGLCGQSVTGEAPAYSRRKPNRTGVLGSS